MVELEVKVVMTKNLVLVELDVHTKFGLDQNFRFRDMDSPFVSEQPIVMSHVLEGRYLDTIIRSQRIGVWS